MFTPGILLTALAVSLFILSVLALTFFTGTPLVFLGDVAVPPRSLVAAVTFGGSVAGSAADLGDSAIVTAAAAGLGGADELCSAGACADEALSWADEGHERLTEPAIKILGSSLNDSDLIPVNDIGNSFPMIRPFG